MNITHYKESAAIRNLKPEWWGSPLVQEEKYQVKPVKREEIIIIKGRRIISTSIPKDELILTASQYCVMGGGGGFPITMGKFAYS
jgi:hypothetical protein